MVATRCLALAEVTTRLAMQDMCLTSTQLHTAADAQMRDQFIFITLLVHDSRRITDCLLKVASA